MFRNVIQSIHFRSRLKVPKNTHWARVIMNIECAALIKNLDYSAMNALEISGDHWKNFGFKSFEVKAFPGFDITRDMPENKYDLIIAEQVFEHLSYPFKAAKNVWEMLNPGGYFLINTPFLLRLHNAPIDCSRWTPTGLKYFLEEAGFKQENIETHGWGNKACVISNFKKWTVFSKYKHPLRNQIEFPVVVWGLARK